jgi:GT2 family glycosyltransferase
VKNTIGIVILNYLAYQDTLECIESIFTQSYKNFEIVVVENASPNESLRVLKETYHNVEKVNIISTSENIGFARGNNLGIKYLKDRGIYNILVINGDTILTQKNYLEKLMTIDFPAEVAIVGTEIIGRDGINQNICKLSDRDLISIQVKEKYFKKVKLFTQLGIYPFIRYIVRLLKGKRVVRDSSIYKTQLLDSCANMLHGSALFFRENYLREYSGFYPDTFLYEEEELLAYICQKLDFRQMYVDDLSIYHKEDSSSDMVSGSNKRKESLFKLKYQLVNIEILKEAIQMTPSQMREKMRDSIK